MATRVDDCDVSRIMGDDAPDVLRPFIESANLLVTECYGNSGVSDDVLRELEKWLAAHLAHSVSQRVVSTKLGDASDTFARASGDGLRGTFYGQQALLFDVNGCIQMRGTTRPTLHSIGGRDCG